MNSCPIIASVFHLPHPASSKCSLPFRSFFWEYNNTTWALTGRHIPCNNLIWWKKPLGYLPCYIHRICSIQITAIFTFYVCSKWNLVLFSGLALFSKFWAWFDWVQQMKVFLSPLKASWNFAISTKGKNLGTHQNPTPAIMMKSSLLMVYSHLPVSVFLNIIFSFFICEERRDKTTMKSFVVNIRPAVVEEDDKNPSESVRSPSWGFPGNHLEGKLPYNEKRRETVSHKMAASKRCYLSRTLFLLHGICSKHGLLK